MPWLTQAGTEPRSRELSLATIAMAGPAQRATRVFGANRDKAQLADVHNT